MSIRQAFTLFCQTSYPNVRLATIACVCTSANRWAAHSIVMLLEFDTFF